MSISTPGDLVLDVARAADPRRVAAATQKLQMVDGGSGGDRFALALEATSPVARKATTSVALPIHAPEIAGRRAAPAASATDPYGALGGSVLQKASEQMMPAPSAATFGVGTAGSVWRSSLAEHLATALAPSVFKLSAHSDRMRAEHTPAVAAAPAPLA